MLMVISPAKTLDYETPPVTHRFTQPQYLDHAQELIQQLRQLTPLQISELMKLSDKLAGLNAARYASWHPEFTPENAKQALLAFKGDVYTGLNAEDFGEDDFAFAQDHLCMLSGLYGVLRPLDLMQPYRLEMGTRLANARGKDLYAFWGERISQWLNEALAAQGDDVLLNLASNEYFGAVKRKALQAQGAASAGHRHRVQGPEERPVQDHQLLRQEGSRHDGSLRDPRAPARPGRAEGLQRPRLLLQRRAVRPGSAGIPQGRPARLTSPGPPPWRAAPLSARRRLLALPFVPPTPLLRRLSPRKSPCGE